MKKGKQVRKAKLNKQISFIKLNNPQMDFESSQNSQNAANAVNHVNLVDV